MKKDLFVDEMHDFLAQGMFFAPEWRNFTAMGSRFFYLCTVFMLLLVGCKGPRKSAPSAPELRLNSVVARIDSTALTRTFISTIEADYSAPIEPRVSGYLRAVEFASGMPVKRGQPLFAIEGGELQNTLMEAEADLYSAQAQLVEARNNYERALPLARIEAVSATQLDQYKAQYAAAQAAVRSAEQRLNSARLEVGYTLISSPIDGIAAATEAHVGDYVGPGSRFEVLTTISNLDTVQVTLSLPTAEYLALRGEAVESYRNADFLSHIRLYLADGTLYPYVGRYDYTRKDVSSGEGTLQLVVRFPNPEALLKAGQFARVVAEVGPRNPYLVVPAEAVNEQQGLNSVWVVGPDSTLSFRRVELGPLLPSGQSIQSGLVAGERLLVDGSQKVHKGEKIRY